MALARVPGRDSGSADPIPFPPSGRETMGQTLAAYDQLMRLVQSAADDVQKAEGGNKAAGTRVRKAMQDVKKAAQDVRMAVLESRSDS